jgi:hypothetical protein
MATQRLRNEDIVTATPATARKPWTTPRLERQGSVDELVQIVKQSGDNDCSGTKRATGPATGC